MNQTKIGKFIKSIRQKQKLSQRQFAQKYGVSSQAVSKWENGKNIPDIAILNQICQDNNMRVDDFINLAQPPHSRFNLKTFLLVIVIIILVSIIIVLLILNKHQTNYQFKTLVPYCDNFNLYGSLVYNNSKSSIYISNITYCGVEDKRQYVKIECALYETNQKVKTKISYQNYYGPEPITLEKFLKKVQFKVDNYEQTCKVYQANSLHLEIDATDANQHLVSYKIPLELKDNCSS